MLRASEVVLPRTPLTSSYVHAASSLPFLGGTIWTSLQERVRQDPHRVAYTFAAKDEHLTFELLYKEASCLARGLMHLGVEKGDTILFTPLYNRHAVTVVFAAAAIGAVFYTPYLFEPMEKHLTEICRKAEINVIISGESDNPRILEAVKAVLPSLQTLPHLKRAFRVTEALNSGFTSFDVIKECSARVSEEELSARNDSVDPEDPVFIIDSSGTTGEPKLVEHGHFSLLNAGRAIVNQRFTKDQDVVMVVQTLAFGDPIPIYMTIAVISAQVASLRLVYTPERDERLPGWTKDIAKAVEKYKCTHADIWPYAWKDMMDSGYLKKYDMSSLIGGVTSAILLTQKSMERFTSHFKEFVNHFGATEIGFAIGNLPDDSDSKRKVTSLGFPLAHIEVKVVDENGRVVPVNTAGELHIRTPYSFIRYIGQPEETKAAKDKWGWYHTGDVGYMDKDGFIYILGRKKDALRYKRFASNLYPGPLEVAAKKHPLVQDAQCIGLPSESLQGDDIYICIKTKENAQLEEANIREHCEKELLSRDWPDCYVFMDDFPTVGQRKKVSKRLLRERVLTLKSAGHFNAQK